MAAKTPARSRTVGGQSAAPMHTSAAVDQLPGLQPDVQQAADRAALRASGPVITDPDLVDRIFDFVLEQIPELGQRAASVKNSIRREYGGEKHYVRQLEETREARADRMRREVRRMFNGRNSAEVARVLQISKATVWRCLRRAGCAEE